MDPSKQQLIAGKHIIGIDPLAKPSLRDKSETSGSPYQPRWFATGEIFLL